jgi:hypothetical protein
MGALNWELKGLFELFRPRFLFWSNLAHLMPDQSMTLIREAFYKLAGFDFDLGVAVPGRLTFIGAGNIPAMLHVGKGSIVGNCVVLGLDPETTIGDNVSIYPYCTLCTATHPLGFGSRRMEWPVTPKPIVIEMATGLP